ncbi:MAG: DUF4124 domain-containing protein [Moraxellaceae bacterium]|nr:DUF4124 domain-containing protein [Moraxellaceae bacterium]
MRSSRFLRVAMLVLCLPALPAQAQIYKYVDASGNLVLTDTPREGAVPVQTSPIMTMPFPKGSSPPSSSAGDPTPARQQALAYTVLLSSPPADTSYRRGEDAVPVAVTVSPSLADGHRLEVLLDGKVISNGGGTSIALDENIDRGTHTLVARVVDSAGKVLASSAAVSFTVQQSSLLSPKPKGK